uniref:Metalloendopeptidase n=1 Tax=Strongyloides stercoralis TaxID=6248 RepID=A0AAF5D3V6_STRER
MLICCYTLTSEKDITTYKNSTSKFLQNILRFENKNRIKYSTTNGINMKALRKSLNILEKNTCLRFRYVKKIRKHQFGLHFLGYMAVKYPDNTPAEDQQLQEIFISNRSSKNTGYLLQQILLSMGYIPQHQRPDRDNYIKFIEMDSEYTILLEDKYKNTYKWDEVELFNTSYDYGSLTQYSIDYFNEVSSSIMSAKWPIYNNMMGQKYGLSFNDVKLINLAICSNNCKNKRQIKCENSGYQDPLDCSKCRCPKGFGGENCSKVFKISKKCKNNLLKATKNLKTLSNRGFAKCNYLITSKKNSKIVIYINSVKTNSRKFCFEDSGFEIKYRNDMGATGLCLCGSHSNMSLISEDNQVLIRYKGNTRSYFKIKYLIKCQNINIEKLNLFSSRAKRGIFKNSKYFLEKFPIKYNITTSINQFNLEKALKIIEKDTCINFKKVKIIPKNSQGFMYQINSANFTFCGPQYPDKPQVIFLSNKCNNNVGCHLRQTVLSIGLLYQFNRPDRDNFININVSNAYWWVYGGEILESIFSKDEINLYDTSYDFGSITQLNGYEYSNNSKLVIKPKIPQYKNMMGQDYKLSFNDAKLLNLKLCKKICLNNFKKCKNNGYQDPHNCYKCRCPNGYTGKYCQNIKKSNTKCGKQKLSAQKYIQTLKISGSNICNYFIKSKIGTKIKITLISLNTKEIIPCFENMGLEIKYRLDKGTTGLCLCGKYKNIQLNSDDNTVLIQYNGENKNHHFILKYQQL